MTAERTGAAYVLESAEVDTILAALRRWQAPTNMDSKQAEAVLALATDDGAHHQLGAADIDALCEYLNCGPTQAAPIDLSACCHAPIGYDGWLDSNGTAITDSMDNCSCMNCGMEGPEVWDGESLPWPRSKREGGSDLPEGVDEPPAKIEYIVLHKQKGAKRAKRGQPLLWLADITFDNGTEEQAPTPQFASMDASVVAGVLLRQHPHATVGVRTADIGAAGDGVMWFDRKKLTRRPAMANLTLALIETIEPEDD